jgi:methionyl-tRNA formyltransferase
MKERLIDWNKEATKIYNLIRGLKPFWGAHTYLMGKMLKIWWAEPLDLKVHENMAGKIIKVERDGLVVGCGEGALKIKELQLEGRERMSAKDFLLGHKVEENTILG